MKRLHSLWLFVALMLGFSLSSKADDMLTMTVTWDTPGSVKIYDGSTNVNNLVSLSASQTSFVCTYEAEYWHTVYVEAAPGYVLVNAECETDHGVYYPNSYTNKISIVLDEHDGHTVHVNVREVERDGNITINFVSGGNVTATFGGTNREYKLQGGTQVVPFSTEVETTLSFYGNANTVGETYYITQNGTNKNWCHPEGEFDLVHDAITLSNGDVFEVKYNDDTPAAPAVYHDVTLNFADGTPSSVVTMIFDQTAMETIEINNPFQAEDGHNIKLVFNTYDYTITVNGSELVPDDGNSTTWFIGEVTEDTVVNISAVERDYGTGYVQLAVDNIEGLIVHNGTYDGPVVDLSLLTPSYSAGYYNYSIEVSLKNPRIFIEAEDGYWIKSSTVILDGDLTDAYSISVEDTQPLRVQMHKITRDTPMGIFVVLGTTGAAYQFTLKNAQGEVFSLAEGQNIINIDQVYDSPFTVIPESTTTVKVYRDYTAVSVDSDSNTYKDILATDNTVLYIFQSATLTQRTAKKQTVTIPADKSGTVVTYDGVKTITESGTFKTYPNAPIVLEPGAGLYVQVDDAKVRLTDGAYSFAVSAAHTIDFLPYVNATSESPLASASPETGIAGGPVQVILNYANAGALYVVFQDNDKLTLEEVSTDPNRYCEHPSRVFDVEKDSTLPSSRRYAASSTVAEGGESGAVVGVEFPEIDMGDRYLDNATLNFTASEGAFLLDGVQSSPELTQSYAGIITFVGSVNIDETTGNVTVYSLDGQLLLDNAPISSFRDLPSGAYILNGKKVVK